MFVNMYHFFQLFCQVVNDYFRYLENLHNTRRWCLCNRKKLIIRKLIKNTIPYNHLDVSYHPKFIYKAIFIKLVEFFVWNSQQIISTLICRRDVFCIQSYIRWKSMNFVSTKERKLRCACDIGCWLFCWHQTHNYTVQRVWTIIKLWRSSTKPKYVNLVREPTNKYKL